MPPVDLPLTEPLHNLPAWTERFRAAEIPVIESVGGGVSDVLIGEEVAGSERASASQHDN